MTLKPGDIIKVRSKTPLGRTDSVTAFESLDSVRQTFSILAGTHVMVLETGIKFRPTGVPLIKVLYKDQIVYIVPSPWFRYELVSS